MLLGNSVSGASLALRSYTTGVMESKVSEIEIYLAFGGSGKESVE